jgi:hypothetical protein
MIFGGLMKQKPKVPFAGVYNTALVGVYNTTKARAKTRGVLVVL